MCIFVCICREGESGENLNHCQSTALLRIKYKLWFESFTQSRILMDLDLPLITLPIFRYLCGFILHLSCTQCWNMTSTGAHVQEWLELRPRELRVRHSEIQIYSRSITCWHSVQHDKITKLFQNDSYLSDTEYHLQMAVRISGKVLIVCYNPTKHHALIHTEPGSLIKSWKQMG